MFLFLVVRVYSMTSLALAGIVTVCWAFNFWVRFWAVLERCGVVHFSSLAVIFGLSTHLHNLSSGFSFGLFSQTGSGFGLGVGVGVGVGVEIVRVGVVLGGVTGGGVGAGVGAGVGTITVPGTNVAGASVGR